MMILIYKPMHALIHELIQERKIILGLIKAVHVELTIQQVAGKAQKVVCQELKGR